MDGLVFETVRCVALVSGCRLVGSAAMTRTRAPEHDRPTRLRVTTAGIIGVVVAVAVGVALGWRYAAAAGWTVAAAVFTGWTWGVIGRMNPQQTLAHATRDNPARLLTDLITLIACVASLGGVVYLLAAASNNGTIE